MSATGGKSAKPANAVVEDPPAPRLQLETVLKVRRELCSLYVEAKKGERDVGDASKLGNLLVMISRMIEGGELEERLQMVEKKLGLTP